MTDVRSCLSAFQLGAMRNIKGQRPTQVIVLFPEVTSCSGAQPKIPGNIHPGQIAVAGKVRRSNAHLTNKRKTYSLFAV